MNAAPIDIDSQQARDMGITPVDPAEFDEPRIEDAPRDRWNVLSGAVWAFSVEVMRSLNWLSTQPWLDPVNKIDAKTATVGTAAALRHRAMGLVKPLQAAVQMPDKPDWVWTALRGAKAVRDAELPVNGADTPSPRTRQWAVQMIDGITLLRQAVEEAAKVGDPKARAAVEDHVGDVALQALREISAERKAAEEAAAADAPQPS